MNAVVLQSHLKVDLELKKTLDPMNANIDLVTFNYIYIKKKFTH